MSIMSSATRVESIAGTHNVGVYRVYLYLDVLARFWCRGRLAKYLLYTTWMNAARWAGPLHQWQWHNHEDGKQFGEIVEKSRRTVWCDNACHGTLEGTTQCQLPA